MSEIATAFDAPWIEPVDGFGDVIFVRADCDYWGLWAEQVKKQRMDKDLAKLRTLPILDPARRAALEREIEDKPQYLGDVIDRQGTPDGLKKIILDSIVAGGRSKEEADKIRKKIGIGRQTQLARLICSEPTPTIEQYRESVRSACVARGMPADQVARLTDTDLIRLAAEIPPAQTIEPEAKDGEGFTDGAE